MNYALSRSVGILALLNTSAIPLHAEVKLPAVISSHMVLQCELAAPVWGTATAGEDVTVSFAGQKKSVKTGADGKWQVKLDPMKASAESRTMTISGENTLTLEDVLVGEVWLGAGQSNMNYGSKHYTQHDGLLANLASKKHPLIRLKMCQPNGWVMAEGENNQEFSALLLSYAVRMQEELKVPVGVMMGSYNGTASTVWLSKQAFAEDAACQEVIQKALATYPAAEIQKKYDLQIADWEKATAAAKEKGQTDMPRKPEAPRKPGELHEEAGGYYEHYIRPLIPYGIRGVLWDQGESGTAETGMDQYTLMGALIRGWRKDWKQGDFPFLYVQKPSGEGCTYDMKDPETMVAGPFTTMPNEVPDDGQYREIHLRIRDYPNTAMVSSSDLGGGEHPPIKSGYGTRASHVALGFAYGTKTEIYGPIYKSHKIEGNKAWISFTHVGKGLVFRGGEKLQGFAIAGDDGKFVWADAVIDGDSVVLSSAKVAKPVSLRYAWSQTQAWANLFNMDGLPALSFRTDRATN